ncbi:MAG: ATP-binding protein, partial [Sphaerochaeta sp.]
MAVIEKPSYRSQEKHHYRTGEKHHYRERAKHPYRTPVKTSYLSQLGYDHLDLEASELIFKLVAARYEQKSIVVTSNFPIS